ncbi:MAG: hypothetical protein CL878_09525, partial [Dehalococcoidia bacterium]|nr:hypothetical protein [Dehalococcoidia bacterium]
ARRIGRALAQARSGQNEPTPDVVHLAVRDAITHCVYGVDKNPLAVDLCKVALWIEGHWRGKPLTFLDHRVKLGDSLVGVMDLDTVEQGIPTDAYKPVTGDDRATVRNLQRENREELRRLQQTGMVQPALETMDRTDSLATLAQQHAAVAQLADDTPVQVHAKRTQYETLHGEGTDWWDRWTACNLWTAAFFTPFIPEEVDQGLVPTTASLLRHIQQPRATNGQLVGAATGLALDYRFFHWPLEFPEVFDQGGFDVVLGNPPWERIKLQEKEFFAGRAPEIAEAPTKAIREELIDELYRTDPELYEAFEQAKQDAEATSKFMRASGRFPLTAKGDVNLYALFAEQTRTMLAPHGRVGIIVPTGIATDNNTKDFFANLIRRRVLAGLFDFENRDAIFPGVHRSYKFCLLTLAGSAVPGGDFGFFLTNTDQMNEPVRRYQLTPEDFALLNPNTRTCPVFRTRADAELTKAIYQRVPVLVNEATGENPWGVSFLEMFSMYSHSRLFHDAPGQGLVPLYEAKLLHQFDHRWATFEGGIVRDCTLEEKTDPTFHVTPRYWVPKEEVEARLEGKWDRAWLLWFRKIARSTDRRTVISSVVPRVGVSYSAPILFARRASALQVCALLGALSSLPFDFAVRQKLGGTNIAFGVMRQFPAHPPTAYTSMDLARIVPRALELLYTAHNIQPFADDVWRKATPELRLELLIRWEESHGQDAPKDADPEDLVLRLPPFRWDAERRATVRAELDAYYARLYGLNRKQLRYILDPHDLTDRELEDILDDREDSPDAPRTTTFPGETFRVLKARELREFGAYRTQRLVLAAWNRMLLAPLQRPAAASVGKSNQ